MSVSLQFVLQIKKKNNDIINPERAETCHNSPRLLQAREKKTILLKHDRPVKSTRKTKPREPRRVAATRERSPDKWTHVRS
jgi:hypothetical protein